MYGVLSRYEAVSRNLPLRQARIPSPWQLAPSWIHLNMKSKRWKGLSLPSPVPTHHLILWTGTSEHRGGHITGNEKGELGSPSPDPCDCIILTPSLAREAQDIKWSNTEAPQFGRLPRPSSQHLPHVGFGLLGSAEREKVAELGRAADFASLLRCYSPGWNSTVGGMGVPSVSCSGPCNHLCRLDTWGGGGCVEYCTLRQASSSPSGGAPTFAAHPLTSMTLLVPPGQAADPGPEAETGEKVLANKGEEGRDAGGVGRRAREGQEHEELPTETTAEIPGRRPRLQTSKPGWEGSVCALHPSPAGAAPWASAQETTAQSPDALNEWG